MNLRVGRKVGRTIYDGDKLIGVMDTTELARLVVDAVNGSAARDRVVEAAIAKRGDSRPGCTCRLCAAVDALLALTDPVKDGAREE